jgi:hypothetical protein
VRCREDIEDGHRVILQVTVQSLTKEITTMTTMDNSAGVQVLGDDVVCSAVDHALEQHTATVVSRDGRHLLAVIPDTLII